MLDFFLGGGGRALDAEERKLGGRLGKRRFESGPRTWKGRFRDGRIREGLGGRVIMGRLKQCSGCARIS